MISYSKKVTLRDCGLIEACRKRFYPGGFNWEKNVGGDALTRRGGTRNNKEALSVPIHSIQDSR